MSDSATSDSARSGRGGLPLYPVLLAIALVLSIVLPTGGSPYAGIRLLTRSASVRCSCPSPPGSCSAPGTGLGWWRASWCVIAFQGH